MTRQITINENRIHAQALTISIDDYDRIQIATEQDGDACIVNGRAVSVYSAWGVETRDYRGFVLSNPHVYNSRLSLVRADGKWAPEHFRSKMYVVLRKAAEDYLREYYADDLTTAQRGRAVQRVRDIDEQVAQLLGERDKLIGEWDMTRAEVYPAAQYPVTL